MISDGLRERIAGSQLYPVTGGGVVFDPRRRQLFALNPSAAFVWLSLSHELDRDDLEQAFAEAFGTDRAAASAAVFEAVAAFDRLDISVPTLPQVAGGSSSTPPSPTGKPSTYRFLDSVVSIHAPPAIEAHVDGLLPGLKVELDPSTPADLTIVVEPSDGGFSIASTHEEACLVSPSGVVAEIERIVVQHGVRSTPHLLTFHAACLAQGNRAILLSGPSGSGKTTLSAVLAKRGWRYGSDELTMVDPEMSWRPIPIPPCIKRDNFDRLSTWYPELADAPAHERYGNTVKYLPLAAKTRSYHVKNVIFPKYSASATPSLTQLESLDGLSRLLAQCVHMTDLFDQAGAESLVAWHDKTRYFDLVHNDAECAAEILEQGIA